MKHRESSSSSSSGTGVLGLLFVAFVVLKLIGKIDWSWWWVCVPVWGPIVLILAGLAIYGLILLIKEGIKKIKSRKKTKA